MAPQEWISITHPPPRFGWYLGALLPVNHRECDQAGLDSWRSKFGCALVWFNPDAIDQWWTPRGRGNPTSAIGHRITHWAEVPAVPPCEYPPITTRSKPFDRSSDAEAPCPECGGSGIAHAGGDVLAWLSGALRECDLERAMYQWDPDNVREFAFLVRSMLTDRRAGGDPW